MASSVTFEGFPYRSRRYLVVDLDHERVEFCLLDPETGRSLVGGRLLAMWLWDKYADYQKQQNSLFDEGNPIVIAPGGLSDLDLSFAHGYAVVTKSPVTGMVECAFGEGPFGSGLCSLGLCAIVLLGRQRRTSSLVIDGSRVAFSVEEELHDQPCGVLRNHYAGWHIAAIGPAAERGNRFASLLCDGENVGRGGLGLSFAHKNLKVLALRGPFHERISYDVTDMGMLLEEYRAAVARQGQRSLIAIGRERGWIALHGFNDFTDGRLWALEKIRDRWMDYLALGPNLGLFNPEHISVLARMCDEVGVDPVSSGIALIAARQDQLADGPELVEVVRSFGMAQSRYSAVMESPTLASYRIGALELLPLDLRVLPAQATLACSGDDTILFEELLGSGGNAYLRGDNLVLARMALRGVEIRMVMETLGLPKAFHGLVCADRHIRPMGMLARLATDGEGHLFTEDAVLELGHEAMRMQDRLDARLGRSRGGRIPDCFVTGVMYGDPGQNLVRTSRLIEVYRALRSSISNA